MLRQTASIVYLQTPALGDITLCEKCLLTDTVLGSADHLALLGGGWTMAIRMAHFGLCVLLQLYIQLKTKLGPGFSLETPTLTPPTTYIHFNYLSK